MYFFNAFAFGPNIIFNWLSISTIPLAPSLWIASLLTIDTSFKVVTVKFRPYKLFVIAGLPMNKIKPILVCLVLMKYNDSIS